MRCISTAPARMQKPRLIWKDILEGILSAPLQAQNYNYEKVRCDNCAFRFIQLLNEKIPDLSMAFGKVIAEERNRKGMTQEQLAEAINYTNVYISLLENGMRQPSLNATILIACELNIKPEVLISRVYELLERY